MSFIITTYYGYHYKVTMRGKYLKTITSQRKLVQALQKSIDDLRKRGQTGYADHLQGLLDEKNFMQIDVLFGMFSKTQRCNSQGVCFK